MTEFHGGENGGMRFEVVYDGSSRPMIQTPKNRLLSLNEFQNGRWGSYDREDSDCRIIVEALNWVLQQDESRIALETEYAEQM